MYLMRHYAKMEANILQISEPDGIIVIWSPFQKQHIFTPILVWVLNSALKKNICKITSLTVQYFHTIFFSVKHHSVFPLLSGTSNKIQFPFMKALSRFTSE